MKLKIFEEKNAKKLEEKFNEFAGKFQVYDRIPKVAMINNEFWYILFVYYAKKNIVED